MAFPDQRCQVSRLPRLSDAGEPSSAGRTIVKAQPVLTRHYQRLRAGGRGAAWRRTRLPCSRARDGCLSGDAVVSDEDGQCISRCVGG